MQTPTLRPQTEPERILLIPDAAEEPRSRSLILLLVLGLVAGMLLGGGVVYAWQQSRIGDSEQAEQAALVQATEARSEAAAALALVDGLEAQVAALETQLRAGQTHQSILEGKNSDAAGQAERALDRMHQAQAQLRAVTGPAVPNGRHIAYLLSAGTAQSPPMMVIDLGRWFTGDAARRAAISDGALRPGEHLFRGRYLRNSGHDWRILPVSTGALFTIRHYGDTTGPVDVSLTTLATIMSSIARSDVRISHDPFWVQVRDHSVASARQQEYRAP